MSSVPAAATSPSTTARSRERTDASVAREPALATVLRALVHACLAGVFAWPITVEEAVMAAATCSAAGVICASFLARSRLRSAVVIAIGVGVVLFARFAAELAIGTDLLAPAVGPAAALRTGDALAFGIGAFGVSATVRTLSIRRPWLTAIEVAFLGAVFAQLVVAHRNGAINRPFEVADPILAQGGDPTVAMMAIGAIGAAVAIVLLLSERNVLRGAFHVAGAVALLLLFLGVLGLMPEPRVPETAPGLGLRPEGDDESDEQGQQDRSGRRNNEDLEFRDNYDNAQNRIPVGVVLLHDDYSPPSSVYYFRQGAFSQYNGVRLVGATRDDVDRDVATTYPTRPTPIEGAPSPGAARSTVETTVALLAEHTRPPALESVIELRPEPNPDPRRFVRMYRAISATLTADYQSMLGAPVGSAEWSDEIWRHYTDAPPDPRYQELATRILDELPEFLIEDRVARAFAVSRYLSREGTYSLRSNHAGADDPTASFLFGDLTGYCVHFAHAAVFLMRTLGVPARVATGYAVDEASRQGGSAILLTGSASHAWPEIYVEGIGWVVIDVAPETVISPPPSPPDPDLQRLLAELVRGRTPLPIDGRTPPAVGRMAASTLEIAGMALGGLFAVSLVLLALVKIWRRTAPLFAGEEARPRVVYRAELDRLAEVALRREWGESREAFARRITATVPSFAPLTRAHVGARFGARTGSDLRAVAHEVRRERARAFPWWRRALGALAPWSWLASR
jgi:transglutaminase-like putative cysteine protease